MIKFPLFKKTKYAIDFKVNGKDNYIILKINKFEDRYFGNKSLMELFHNKLKDIFHKDVEINIVDVRKL